MSEIDILLTDFDQKISGWTAFSFTSEVDSAANSFSLSLPFTGTPAERRHFRPYSPGVVKIMIGERVLLHGYFEVVAHAFSPGEKSIALSGRSACGGILDWSAGGVFTRAGIYTGTIFEYKEKKLGANALMEKIAGAHHIRFDPDIPAMPAVAIESGQTVFDVVSKIAAVHGYFGVPQSGQINSVNGSKISDGFSLVYKNSLGKTPPVAALTEETPGIRSISTSHDVTKRFWAYLCVGGTDSDPKKHTFLKEIADLPGDRTSQRALSQGIRGIRIIEPEQGSTDYRKAAAFARSRALIDSYQVSVDLDGLFYAPGKLWTAGDVVTLHAPSAAVYTETALIIKRATLSTDAGSGAHAVLELGFPELYRGGFPEVFPWDF